jgi:polyvinyl alcohol dehydrogenase (cytochrome)
MMSIAYPLRREEREAIANFLGTKTEDVPFPPSAFCSEKEPPLTTDSSKNWTGWSPSFSNTRFQTAESAALTASQIPSLKLKWAFGFPGDIIAFGATTVRGVTLFTGSARGTVHAINAKTGCLYWTFQANGPVRAAPLIVEYGAGYSLVFGDQVGWFYALDAKTGKLIWKRRIEDHESTRLTGSAAFDDGIVFVPAASWEETRAVSADYPCCTFRGSVTALRVSDGSQVWKAYLVESPHKTHDPKRGAPGFGPSGAPVWSAPTVDTKHGALYVTTGDNYSPPATTTSDAIVALNLKTGQIVWSKQTTPADVWNAGCAGDNANCPEHLGPDFDFGASAMLVTKEGHDVLIAGQKSGMVYALDPDQNGKILWQARVGKGGIHGGVQWGMASDGANVYASVSEELKKQGEATSLGNAPVGDAMFDPVQGGGLTALRLADGVKVWFAPSQQCAPSRAGCSPAQPGALSSIPGAVFSGSMDGHIRAFTTEDGHLLWDFDTARDFTTVNGVPAHGGSLDGAGPVIVDGILYVNSGYPRFGGMPGNVLLAFSLDGK